mmetsp:Transcript_20383/g.44273  ORF Transcript_20383/g.44273 Transcript_20383/m.44273 type:complete len:83 (-) Transcript_20383:123-371(-)
MGGGSIGEPPTSLEFGGSGIRSRQPLAFSSASLQNGMIGGLCWQLAPSRNPFGLGLLSESSSGDVDWGAGAMTHYGETIARQ